MKEGDGEGKGAEEKLKRLRKRNAELVALARQLDEKTKSLKAENEQLVCADPPPSSPSLSPLWLNYKNKYRIQSVYNVYMYMYMYMYIYMFMYMYKILNTYNVHVHIL